MLLGGWEWDPASRELRRGRECRKLTGLEAGLLDYLARRPGRTVPTEELLHQVWGYTAGIHSRAVACVVARLRRKLGRARKHLQTDYGRGYRLQLPRVDLIGRQATIKRALTMLRDHRWITLYGPPGVGKTRVAQALSEHHPTLWVDAASTMTAQALDTVVSKAMGDAPACVRLVVDGLESVAEPWAPMVQRWLRTAPELRVITTSQVLCGTGPSLHVGPLCTSDGVQLLQWAAQGIDPAPLVCQEDALAIVQAVDALPLGIISAVTRLSLIQPRPLLRRLKHDLSALGDGPGSFLWRCGSAWSRLSPISRRVLEASTTLSTPFTLPELERACAMPQNCTLNGLESLVRSSWIATDNGRFTLLAVLRQFVIGRVSASLQRTLPTDRKAIGSRPSPHSVAK